MALGLVKKTNRLEGSGLQKLMILNFVCYEEKASKQSHLHVRTNQVPSWLGFYLRTSLQISRILMGFKFLNLCPGCNKNAEYLSKDCCRNSFIIFLLSSVATMRYLNTDPLASVPLNPLTVLRIFSNPALNYLISAKFDF